MSIHHRNRTDNISKIKYFLPGHRAHRENRQSRSFIQSRAPTRKQSGFEEVKKEQPITLNSFTKNDISFEVVGISDVNVEKPKQVKVEEGKKIFSMFPEGKEKQQFLKFVQGLKNDQNYQNTVTMFTIMYYYEKKTGQKMNNFF